MALTDDEKKEIKDITDTSIKSHFDNLKKELTDIWKPEQPGKKEDEGGPGKEQTVPQPGPAKSNKDMEQPEEQPEKKESLLKQIVKAIW
jgi:hypothetical protein